MGSDLMARDNIWGTVALMARRTTSLKRNAEGEPLHEKVDQDLEAQILIVDCELIGKRDEVGKR
jgi:hypothetical protein